jgi:hypothetical protein
LTRRRRVMSVLSRLIAAAACVLVVTATAACGDGGKEGASPATPTLAPSTPAAKPTVDPSVPLVEFRSPDKNYTIGYPEGWEELKDVSGPDFIVFSWDLNGPVAQLTILCNEGQNQTLDTLVAGDNAVMRRFGGTGLSGPTPIEVAGLPGTQMTYVANYSGLVVEQAAAYVIDGDCGWRIGIATYGRGSLQSFLPLFERILASFRLG